MPTRSKDRCPVEGAEVVAITLVAKCTKPGSLAGPFGPAEAERLRQAARFVVAPLAAPAARAAMAALLEAYLGRRSAARVQAGALRRGIGETIRAALLYADLRDFTALSETSEPAVMIAALDAWFDRVAGAVHAFGGEVLKFIGDGVLAMFPVTGAPAEACGAALRAVSAARAGMAHLDAAPQARGLPPLSFGAALHLGEILWGNIGAADRLDFTAIGPAVNLVSRLEGLCWRSITRPSSVLTFILRTSPRTSVSKSTPFSATARASMGWQAAVSSSCPIIPNKIRPLLREMSATAAPIAA